MLGCLLMTNPTLEQTRAILDSLRFEGLTTHDIADRLALYQVEGNERRVRKWYHGTTSIRVVEYRALRDLLHEIR